MTGLKWSFELNIQESAPGAQGSSLSRLEVKVKKELIIDCPECGSPLEVEEDAENVWFDTGEEVVLIPRALLKYLDRSQGLLGFS